MENHHLYLKNQCLHLRNIWWCLACLFLQLSTWCLYSSSSISTGTSADVTTLLSLFALWCSVLILSADLSLPVSFLFIHLLAFLIASDWKKSMYSGILTSQPAQDISPPLFFHCLREAFARIDCCIYWNKACYILKLFHSIFYNIDKIYHNIV